eukprot:TRINITY_DN4200_c0_g4_i2.p1 TRINITY_DN4200_c0_g4~~TRINITY_DN4200_c0_g4_i2.p1  ORF type:complete len:670 (+),score=110.55 TRINITY_DN4200_c0_g4_i2:138-2147(+)
MNQPRIGHRVCVLVRCRPLLQHEAGHSTCAVTTMPQYRAVRVVTKSPTFTGAFVESAKIYQFDSVLDAAASQEDLFYCGNGEAMVATVLDGFHSTIFAYGQTGSGKTYTLEGHDYLADEMDTPFADFRTAPEQLGLTPRVIASLFQQIEQRAGDGRIYSIRCSAVQIYNEQVLDLLNPDAAAAHAVNEQNQENTGNERPPGSPGLRMRFNNEHGFYVENLFVYECATAKDVQEVWRTAVRLKTMRVNHMDIASSRSHCLFTIHVDAISRTNPTDTRYGKFTLVDLAGSERTAHAPDGAQHETIDINKSLFALGKVIASLSESGQRQHVPYRDSKLTMLLRDSLGGSAMTLMIGCISPSDLCLEENISTLQYASRAKLVHNHMIVNEDPASRAIRDLQNEVSRVKSRLQHLSQSVSPDVFIETPSPSGSSTPRMTVSGADVLPSHRRSSLKQQLTPPQAMPAIHLTNATPSPESLVPMQMHIPQRPHDSSDAELAKLHRDLAAAADKLQAHPHVRALGAHSVMNTSGLSSDEAVQLRYEMDNLRLHNVALTQKLQAYASSLQQVSMDTLHATSTYQTVHSSQVQAQGRPLSGTVRPRPPPLQNKYHQPLTRTADEEADSVPLTMEEYHVNPYNYPLSGLMTVNEMRDLFSDPRPNVLPPSLSLVVHGGSS